MAKLYAKHSAAIYAKLLVAQNLPVARFLLFVDSRFAGDQVLARFAPKSRKCRREICLLCDLSCKLQSLVV